MKIGGLQRVSLIDYPGLICGIVFLQGCNFKCPYCHNPELVDPQLYQPRIKENDILEFLDTRRGKLDAVTVTGGEPTLQDYLPSFLRKIKEMQFAVKLDTNGTEPDVIKDLLDEKLIDFIAMDIKAPLEKYKNIVRVNIDTDLIRESIGIILMSGIPYEYRTTIVESQIDENDILEIGKLISGARSYVLQKFVPTKTLDKKFLKEKSWPDEKFQEIKKQLENQVKSVTVR
jgi:pyruvate formate lyase activating enzyme